jgi:hypothetical protein
VDVTPPRWQLRAAEAFAGSPEEDVWMMVVDSKITGGLRLLAPGKGPLLRKGRNEFTYRSLSRPERTFIDAMLVAKLATKISDDESAPVIPLPLPVEFTLQPQKSDVRLDGEEVYREAPGEIVVETPHPSAKASRKRRQAG